MISEATFYGRSKEWSSAVDISICAQVARLNLVSMTTSSKKVKAEKATNFERPGGPIYFIVNRGANAFSFADAGGTAVISIPVGYVCEALLVDNTTANGTWRARVKPVLT